MRQSARTRLIAECEGAIERFGSLEAELEEAMRPQRERHGITAEWADRHQTAALEHAREKD